MGVAVSEQRLLLYIYIYIVCSYIYCTDSTLPSVQSFRFGPEIAYVAACTLSTLKGVWRQTLVGSTHEGTCIFMYIYVYVCIMCYVICIITLGILHSAKFQLISIDILV